MQALVPTNQCSIWPINKFDNPVAKALDVPNGIEELENKALRIAIWSINLFPLASSNNPSSESASDNLVATRSHFYSLTEEIHKRIANARKAVACEVPECPLLILVQVTILIASKVTKIHCRYNRLRRTTQDSFAIMSKMRNNISANEPISDTATIAKPCFMKTPRVTPTNLPTSGTYCSHRSSQNFSSW